MGLESDRGGSEARSEACVETSLPIAYHLYLPEAWANDHNKAGIPDDIVFQTKPQIVPGQTRSALQAVVSPAIVLMDAGYGVDTEFRNGITELGLCYVAGISSSTSVWAPGAAPKPPKRWSGNGRPPKLIRRDPSPAVSRQFGCSPNCVCGKGEKARGAARWSGSKPHRFLPEPSVKWLCNVRFL